MIQPSNTTKPPLAAGVRTLVVDMSPAAIERRLRTVGELHKCWQSLRRFKPAEKQKSADETKS
jgi:hypothetical protein